MANTALPENTSNSVGFVGITKTTDEEERLLVLLGKTIAAAGKPLNCVAAPGAVAAVRVGMRAEGGTVNLLDKNTITDSAHTFVYADERLMTRLRKAYPLIDTDRRVILMRTPDDLREWLDAARQVLDERKIKFPV